MNNNAMNILAIGAVIAGGFAVYKLMKPTTELVSDVGSSVSRAVDAPVYLLGTTTDSAGRIIGTVGSETERSLRNVGEAAYQSTGLISDIATQVRRAENYAVNTVANFVKGGSTGLQDIVRKVKTKSNIVITPEQQATAILATKNYYANLKTISPIQHAKDVLSGRYSLRQSKA